MKKQILTALAALAVTAAASAQYAEDLRIYINPGHGSWTANDRPCQLVNHPEPFSRTNTDTLSFFESNTDLIKGFALLERLIEYGFTFDPDLNQGPDSMIHGAARDMENNIVMSRVKNGPYFEDNGTPNQLGNAYPKNGEVFNRNLSEICAEVEANYFDMFISIHSNAASFDGNTNVPLFLYRGYDSMKEDSGNIFADVQRECRTMAEKCWPYAYGNIHMGWTGQSMTDPYIKGDIDFYHSYSTVAGCKGYLGVLKHTSPGFLVEGYFHTYQPARHRAMNWDVCRVEGIAYARGIADYFELDKEETGTIYGIIRDKENKFTHQFYNPNDKTLDVYMPLNGVTVTLKQNGQVVDTYLTDDNYNGAYVFDHVEPGTYTVTMEHPDYDTLESDPIEVTAAEDTFPTHFMVRSAGVQDITVDTGELPTVYYNLQGQRVVTPAAGGIYIKATPLGATKVIL